MGLQFVSYSLQIHVLFMADSAWNATFGWAYGLGFDWNEVGIWNSFFVLSWRGNGYSGFALRYNGAILGLERGCGNVFSPVTLMASSAIGTLSVSLYTAALCSA